MKKLRDLLAAVFIAAMLAFTAGYPVSATAENPIQNDGQKDSQEEAKGSTTEKANLDSQGVILKGFDVVAYFKQGKPVKGDPAIESVYQGAKYYFVSVANKTEFEKNPSKYAPQYGGFCAYGVANGVLADPEGGNFVTVYKAKLYLCGNQGALKSFKVDIEDNINKADKNWVQLAGQ